MPQEQNDPTTHIQAFEHARAMASMVSMRQEAQALRFKEYWEPRAVAALAAAATDSQALLRQALADYPRLPAGQANPSAFRLWLQASLAAIARDKCAQAEDVLLDMTRQESRTLVRIITLRGLAGPQVDMEPKGQSLAGGPALAEASGRAAQAFAQGVEELLAKAWQREADPRALGQGLVKLTSTYNNRLKTIAVTTSHAVANRLRLAVAQASDY